MIRKSARSCLSLSAEKLALGRRACQSAGAAGAPNPRSMQSRRNSVAHVRNLPRARGKYPVYLRAEISLAEACMTAQGHSSFLTTLLLAGVLTGCHKTAAAPARQALSCSRRARGLAKLSR